MSAYLDKCMIGDCRDSLRTMIEDGIKAKMCVTSPPYYGLRDYGVEGQLGLESSPFEYITDMVKVFRLVREVLSDDGTLWINIGDSYAGNGAGYGDSKSTLQGTKQSSRMGAHRKAKLGPGLKPKDLIGIPWMLAFALRADGWYLRQDIIWAKPNPMPESVRDRCTRSHEYVFLLSKSATYYYDSEAIKEPAASSSLDRWNQNVDAQRGSDRVPGKTNGTMKAVGAPRSKSNSFKREGSKREQPIPGQGYGTHRPDREESSYDIEKRNRRSVWEIAVSGYKDAHFATFPTALVEPCIVAGSRPGDIVLDPFLGSGTTAEVAQNLGRHWIGCELNAAYLKLQAKRTAQLGLVLPMEAA